MISVPWKTKFHVLNLLSASAFNFDKVENVLSGKKQFSFSHNVSYPFEELFYIFIKFEIHSVVCKLLSLEKSLNFVVWERVNSLPYNLDFQGPVERGTLKTCIFSFFHNVLNVSGGLFLPYKVLKLGIVQWRINFK